LEKLSEKLGIEKRTHFLGRVVGDDLPMLYMTGKVFAITSKTETQSIVVMEAMASGLSVVAVQAGAIPELVKNGKTGYLCQPDDPTAVSRSISRLLKNDSLRQKCSKTALKNIQKHDIAYTLTRFEEIYKDVVERHNAKLKN
jgi:glycosyltransferase involved in cell wall biosynthesis